MVGLRAGLTDTPHEPGESDLTEAVTRVGTVALGVRGARRTVVAWFFVQIVSVSSSKAAATRSRT
jgi:hypothetical protein